MDNTAEAISNPSIMGCFDALEEEHDYYVDDLDIEGSLPKDLQGTFYRNGPGRLKIRDQIFGHWFDGDGMIAATTFKNNTVHFKNRFIRTKKYIDETAAQKILYRGIGNEAPGGFLKNAFRPPENPANTSLMFNDGRLLALWEGGQPFELDPATLESKGAYYFEGGLKRAQTFSAHPKRNSKTGFYYNFGTGVNGFNLKGPKMCFWLYKISPEGKIVQKKAFPMETYCFFHDFALTENYAIFFFTSIVVQNMGSIALGLKKPSDCITYDENRECEVVVVDLNKMKIARTFKLDPMAVVHFGNSHEKDGKLFVDACKIHNFDTQEHLSNLFSPDFDFSTGGARYCQYEINLAANSVNCREINEDALPCEFPQWNWQQTAIETRYAYATSFCENGSKQFFNSIQKFDKQTGEVTFHDCGPYRFTGEALFIPKEGAKAEDDGYLVSYLYDCHTEKSEVLILDARNIEDKICTVRFHHHIPQGFHCLYTPKTF